VFDFFTVQDPQEDYLPNVKYQAYQNKAGVFPQPVSNEGGSPGWTDVNTNPPPPALGQQRMVTGAENGVPTRGLLNINTASWRALSAMQLAEPYPRGGTGPMSRDQWKLLFDPVTGQWTLQAGANGIDDNIDIAKLIVWYRDGVVDPASGMRPGQHGPYRSIFDLYRLFGIRQYYDQGVVNSDDEPDDFDGDFSPANGQAGAAPNAPKTDGFRNDYEERLLLVNRLGNLITTRSDTFTVYIVVEGWRNAGSIDPGKPPEKIVERRAAFIADRSRITSKGGQLKVINIPTE